MGPRLPAVADAPAGPSLTLEKVYGPGVAFCARSSWRGDTLLASPHLRDAYTATFLTIAGDCPIICSRGALQRPGLELLEAAGLPCASRLHPYGDRTEFE